MVVAEGGIWKRAKLGRGQENLKVGAGGRQW
jgi:hypothetical protein